MPLSFATILGGMVTLIGTPPNIIIAAYREENLGTAYSMFDFAPVGGVCALVGLLFVATIGWRLLPKGRTAPPSGPDFDLEAYVAEALVPEGSSLIDRKVRELDDLAAEGEIDIVGLVRGGKRLPGMARHARIAKGDLLVIKGGPGDLERFVSSQKLEHAAVEGKKAGLLATNDVTLMEVVVAPGSRIAGRSAMSLRLKYRFGVHLIGVSRGGKPFRERLRQLEIEAGDVLLLQGNANELPDVVKWMGCLPALAAGPATQQDGQGVAGGRQLRGRGRARELWRALPTGRVGVRSDRDGVVQSGPAPRGLREHRVARDRLAGIDDPARGGARNHGLHRPDRRRHRQPDSWPASGVVVAWRADRSSR